MRKRLVFAAIVACCFSIPALAAPVQPAPPVSAIDPQALAAANQMLTAMGYDRMMQQTCDALVAQMAPAFRKAIEDKTGQPADDALINRLTGIEFDFMEKTIVRSPDVRRAIATLYASKFTAAELNHLANLYNDPVMRKWTEVAPDMTAKMFPLIESVVDSHRDELEASIKAAVADYYDDAPKPPQS